MNGLLRGVLFGQRKRRYAHAFQVVEFSIQDNHLHLIMEAYGEDPRLAEHARDIALSAGTCQRV